MVYRAFYRKTSFKKKSNVIASTEINSLKTLESLLNISGFNFLTRYTDSDLVDAQNVTILLIILFILSIKIDVQRKKMR
jgi:hypothetical protein